MASFGLLVGTIVGRRFSFGLSAVGPYFGQKQWRLHSFHYEIATSKIKSKVNETYSGESPCILLEKRSGKNPKAILSVTMSPVHRSLVHVESIVRINLKIQKKLFWLIDLKELYCLIHRFLSIFREHNIYIVGSRGASQLGGSLLTHVCRLYKFIASSGIWSIVGSSLRTVTWICCS